MAMAVTPDCTLALTASADHLVVRYDFLVRQTNYSYGLVFH